MTLNAYRRHLRSCAYFGPGGRDIRPNKCNCPFHVDGKHSGKRFRDSLGTRNQQTAERKVSEMIRRLDAEYLATLARTSDPQPVREVPGVAKAIELFLNSGGPIDKTGKMQSDLKYSSWRKYRNVLNHLAAFCQTRRIESLAQIGAVELEQYRGTRTTLALRTWKTELQSLRTFFHYCVRNKWVATNCAAEVRGPRHLTPNDVVPYTAADEIRILAACEQIGGGRYTRRDAIYERLRAKAMIVVLRHTALRISDVTKLRRDALSWDSASRTWRVRIRTTKTGESVHLPIPPDLKQALDVLPLPRNAPRDCPYFFWNGVSTERAVVGTAERTLYTVFQRSGVPDAHAHRFRHTLATRLLAAGATFEQVADVLGNTPSVVRRHYGKWSKGRQDAIDRLMHAHYQTLPDTDAVTKQSHQKSVPVN